MRHKDAGDLADGNPPEINGRARRQTPVRFARMMKYGIMGQYNFSPLQPPNGSLSVAVLRNMTGFVYGFPPRNTPSHPTIPVLPTSYLHSSRLYSLAR